MGIQYNPSIVTDGLVLCLDAANKRSYPGTGTVWTDLAEDNDLTLHNSPAFQTNNGGRFQFDGTDDYGQFSSLDITGGNNYTFMFVVDVRVAPSTAYHYILDDSNSLSGFGIRLATSSALQFFAYDSSSGSAVVSTRSDTLSLNTIYHLTFIIRTSYFDSYINAGSKQTDAGIANNIKASSDNMRLGSRSDQVSEMWDGRFYSASIYNRVLNDEEIRQNYEATKGRYA